MELDIDNAGHSSKSSSLSIDIDVDETQCDSFNGSNQKLKPNRKRRLSMIEEEPSGKVFVQDSEDDYNYSKLLSLSDEVLLEILKNCNSLTLDALSKTCIRFKNLVCDRRLWTSFDYSKLALSVDEILKRFKYINKDTTEFKIKGLVKSFPHKKWQNNTITENLLEKLQKLTPHLESLEVYEGFLDFQKFTINEFPNTIRKLVFCGCEVNFASPARAFFNRIDTHMKHLQELSLERCTWFETHDLIMFSKLPQLKKLNLRGCVSLKECVPYGSIATRFGFRQLESLDIRDTPISDSDIQCFNITTTLRELLMECPIDLRNQSTTRSAACCDLEPVNEEEELRLEPNANERNEQNAQASDEPEQPNQSVNQQPEVAATSAAADQSSPAQQQQQQQPQQQQNRDDDVRISNHYINIVVRNHNYVDIQNNVGERRDGRDAVHENNPQMFVPNNIDVNPQPQQLIIVRGLNCNTGNRDRAVGRRNRISWEIVNHNNHQQYAQLFYNRPINRTFEPPPVTLISDRGICSFGVSPDNIQNGVVWIRADFRSPDTFLETLVVRHYKLVTDVSLRHLVHCSPKLSYLDVTGTSVTEAGVQAFKTKKPLCTVVSDFDV